MLARPEFAGWSRSEWCLAIIRTALRYYVGEPGAGEAARAPAAPAAPADPAPAREAPAPTRQAPAQEEPVIREEEPLVIAEDEALERPDCSHPLDARDYDSGTCAACGAILWD